MKHQYIERNTRQVNTENLYGNQAVQFLYSDIELFDFTHVCLIENDAAMGQGPQKQRDSFQVSRLAPGTGNHASYI